MSKEKLTDEQIIKALENCSDGSDIGLIGATLNLINRLKQSYVVKAYDQLRAENKTLKTANRLYAVELGKKDKTEYEKALTNERKETAKEIYCFMDDLMRVFMDDDDGITMKYCEFQANTKNFLKEKYGVEIG